MRAGEDDLFPAGIKAFPAIDGDMLLVGAGSATTAIGARSGLRLAAAVG
jgi:hypothetical protein